MKLTLSAESEGHILSEPKVGACYVSLLVAAVADDACQCVSVIGIGSVAGRTSVRVWSKAGDIGVGDGRKLCLVRHVVYRALIDVRIAWKALPTRASRCVHVVAVAALAASRGTPLP